MSHYQNLNTLRALLIGWVLANEERTSTFLGERNYVGMSDAGKAFGCLRQAVASKAHRDKLYPTLEEIGKMSDEQVLQALERIRPLERGHEQEEGINEAYKALGYDVCGQLEIRINHKGIPVVGHLDFTIFEFTRIHVVESKSNENIPEVLYSSYEGQINGQIGLMHRHFYDPVFSVRDPSGKLIVESQPMPVVIEVLTGRKVTERPEITGEVLSMSGRTARVFGPYKPTDMMTDLVLRKSEYIWDRAHLVKQGTLSLDKIPYAKGFYPLCDYCDYSYDCPKFTDAAKIPEFNGAIHILKDLQAEEKRIKAEIKRVKADLADSYEAQGHDGYKYVNTGDFRFRNNPRSRSTLNKDILRDYLNEVYGLSFESIDVLIQDCSKVSNFKQVDISKVAPPKKKEAKKKTQKAA